MALRRAARSFAEMVSGSVSAALTVEPSSGRPRVTAAARKIIAQSRALMVTHVEISTLEGKARGQP
jgi:hypothetical protein